MDDYRLIDHVPIAVANIDKGHGGTYWEPSGGVAAEAVVAWLDWQLRGDQQAGRIFAGDSCRLCTDAQWEFMSKGLDSRQSQLLLASAAFAASRIRRC